MAGPQDIFGGLATWREKLGKGARQGRMTEVRLERSNPGALTMRSYCPPGLPNGAPLIVVLHGCSQTAEGYAEGAGWLTLADRFGFAVLAPEQTTANNPNRCFNWFLPGDTARDMGEAASIAEMIQLALVEHQLDRKRVFVTGLSAGGAMTAVMLATYPELFAGGGIIAGLPYRIARSMPEAFAAMAQGGRASAQELGNSVREATAYRGPWPTVSVWQGNDDRTVKPINAENLVGQWCNIHDLRGGGIEMISGDGRPYRAWRSEEDQTLVELHRLPLMGHGTPLKCRGPDACGQPGPFLLDVGVSSSLELVRSWGLHSGLSAFVAKEIAPLEPEILDRGPAPTAGDRSQPRHVGESPVLKVINDALRTAGLLR